MLHVIAKSGRELNSAFQIGDFQGVSGLILESWGPSSRNADYGEALEVIIERAQFKGVKYIEVNVISKNLVSLLPNFSDRAVVVNGSSLIRLQGWSAKDIRLAIGRAQARLKHDPAKTGGNRSKRILLSSPELTLEEWNTIAVPSTSSAPRSPQDLAIIPPGTQKPVGVALLTVVIERDAKVRSWVLLNARGICELCGHAAPFLDLEGVPFLEVHHVIPLASGGPDTTTNAVALCPNCHRELHHGAGKLLKLEFLYGNVKRLVRETCCG